MSNWTNKYKLSGIPVITEDKPGALIEKVLNEIQDKALVEIEAAEETSGNGISYPVVLTVDELDSNRRRIAGSVTVPEGGGRGDGQTIGEDESSGETQLYVVGRDSAETYQVFQKKGDGQFGFDWVRAH